ncbi:MAG: poly-beta,6-N-acetyl-D-glucosamine biosynthesis protein PgaD [Pseudomonadota bacterium]|jgi:hypothetical protein
MRRRAARIRALFLRRVSPLEVPPHVQVRTRPGRPLVRENSWYLKPRARALLGTLNLLGWSIWLILVGPVLTSLAWSISVWVVQREWIEADGIRGVANFIATDLPLGLAFCLAFLLWAGVRAWSQRRLKVARRIAQRVAAAQGLEADAATKLGPPSDAQEAHSQATLKAPLPAPLPAPLQASVDQAYAQQCLVCHHHPGGELKDVEPVQLQPVLPMRSTALKDRVKAPFKPE